VSGVSPAAGRGAASLIQKRNFEKANPPEADKYRIINVECRRNVFCQFKKHTEQAYSAKQATKAKSEPTILNSGF